MSISTLIERLLRRLRDGFSAVACYYKALLIYIIDIVSRDAILLYLLANDLEVLTIASSYIGLIAYMV
jgi:hypothetical protein